MRWNPALERASAAASVVFPTPGIFDQQMATRDQANDGDADDLGLADEGPGHAGLEPGHQFDCTFHTLHTYHARTMLADPVFFRDLAYVFGAAVLGGALAWMTRQPLVLGFVLGGIVIGPFTPGPTVADLRAFELFAEIGVMLLMFSIGIEFSLRDLLRVKWVALVGGPLGIVLTVLAARGSVTSWA